MKDIPRQTRPNIVSAAAALLAFEAGVALVAMLALDPSLLLLSQALLRFGDDPFVGNTALIGFVLSPVGASSIAMAATVAILLDAVEVGGAFLILWRAGEGQAVRLPGVLRRLASRLPALLGLSACAFAVLVVLAIPAALAALGSRMFILSDGDIYYYVTTRPPEFLAAAGLVLTVTAAGVAAAFWLLLRYGLSVPAVLLEGLSARAALRASAQATAGMRRRLFAGLLVWAVAVAVLYAAFAAGLRFLFDALVSPDLPLGSTRSASLLVAAVAACGAVVLARAARVGLALVLARAWRRALKAAPTVPALAAADAPPPRRRTRAALVAAVLLAAAAHGVWAFGPAGEHRVAVTAHRAGSTAAPENTLAALRQAVADGADYVEIDVQETSDGEVVLLHDIDLRRVAGVARPIWTMRYDEIKDLDVGSWFAPRFTAERIPTLRAFAEAARGRVKLNVEVKVNPHEADLARRTLAALDAAGMRHDSVITSLDLGMLQEVRTLAPEVPVGLIVATGVGNLRRVDVDAFALSRRWATPARIGAIAASGRQVYVWTLDDEHALATAMLDGADNVITSNTRLAIAVRRWFDDLTPPERSILRLQNGLAGRASLNPRSGVPATAEDDE